MPNLNGFFSRVGRLQERIDELDQKIRTADSRMRRRPPLTGALASVDQGIHEADARIRGAAHGPTCPVAPEMPFPAVAQSEPAQPAAPQGKGTHCIPCLPGDSLILANPAPKAIATISPGERILDASGAFTTVSAVMQRPYQGDLVELSLPYFNKPLRLTPEHPVLVVEARSCRALHHGLCLPGKDNPRCQGCKYRRTYPLQWVAAGTLTVTPSSRFSSHVLLMPRLANTEDIPYLQLKRYYQKPLKEKDGWLLPIKAKHRGYGMPVKADIPLERDLLRLIGFYLAEGHVSSCTRGLHLRFSFGKHEPELAQETRDSLQRVFGVTAYIEEKRTSICIAVNSNIVAAFFSAEFGHGAHEKRLPRWLLYLPIEKQQYLLQAYWAGDGCRDKRNNSFSASTVSPALAFGLRLMLHRLGIVHGLALRPTGQSYIDGRKIAGHEHYEIRVSGPSAIKFAKIMSLPTIRWRFLASHIVGMDNNWVYVPIKGISKQAYSGPVFNLRTESNSYTMAGIVVHNCSANHLSVCGGLLGEALRFARADGLGSTEVVQRVGMCLDELNAMERVDLRAEVVFRLPPQEKAVAEKALIRGRALRHSLEHLAGVDGLEKAAAESQQLRGELFKDWWKLKYQALSPAEKEKLKEAVAAIGEKEMG